MYPSTSPQTTVCMALAFGSRTSTTPHAYIYGHWILAAPNKEENQETVLDRGLCVCPATSGRSLCRQRRWLPSREEIPKIARVVEVFLHATRTHVPPERIHQCWSVRHTEIPMQNLEGIRQNIVRKLDEVATRCPSPIAWDPFAFPLLMIHGWREEALCTGPERHLTSERVCPDSKSCSRDDKGEYPYSGCALIFEGSMLVYNPQRDIAQWVPVRGMSGTLTMPELRVAHDLNNMVPLPLSESPAAKPPPIRGYEMHSGRC